MSQTKGSSDGAAEEGGGVGRLLASSPDIFPSPLSEETIDHCVNSWDEEANVIYGEDGVVWQTETVIIITKWSDVAMMQTAFCLGSN